MPASARGPSSLAKSFTHADEVRTPVKTRSEIVRLDTVSVSRTTIEPGWTWEESIQPIARTENCQIHHVGYALSGTLGIRLKSGAELTIRAGDAYEIEPGHTAWVIGDEPFVGLEFANAEQFAKPQ